MKTLNRWSRNYSCSKTSLAKIRAIPPRICDRLGVEYTNDHIIFQGDKFSRHSTALSWTKTYKYLLDFLAARDWSLRIDLAKFIWETGIWTLTTHRIHISMYISTTLFSCQNNDPSRPNRTRNLSKEGLHTENSGLSRENPNPGWKLSEQNQAQGKNYTSLVSGLEGESFLFYSSPVRPGKTPLDPMYARQDLAVRNKTPIYCLNLALFILKFLKCSPTLLIFRHFFLYYSFLFIIQS